MQEYRIETTISKDGTLTIKKLPFRAGERVEVIVHPHEPQPEYEMRYPLRGKPIRYIDPFRSVAENDWDVLQ
jgi:hypothetical protein